MAKSTNPSDKDHQAPDGGWGWCVVAASFLAHVISDGIMYTNGIVLREVREYFEASRQTMGIMASVTAVVAYGSTGLNGAMVKRWGCRPVGAVGGLVLGVGLITSSFAPNMNFLFFSFALVAAWGVGIVYVPSVIIVTEYFYKRRSFAIGLAVSGAGIGTFAFAPLVKCLLEWYGWRGCFVILGALALNCVACGLIYRPLKYKLGDEVTVAPQTSTNNLTPDVAETNSEKERVYLNVHYSLPNILAAPSRDSEQVIWRRNSTTDLYVLRNEKKQPDIIPCRNNEEGPHEKTGFISVDHTFNNVCNKTDDLEIAVSVESSSWHKRWSKRRFIDYVERCAVILNKRAILAWSIGNFFTGFASATVFTFLPDLAVETGYSKSDAAFLISTAGIASTVSRALLGWVSDKPFIKKPVAYAVITMVLSISMALFPASTAHYGLLVCNAIVYGTGHGYRIAQISVVVAELVGTNLIGSGMGLLFFTGAVGALFGSPFAGMLFDKSGSYTLSFAVMGSISLFGSIFSWLVLCTPEYKESRKRLKAERSCMKTSS